MAVNKTKTHSFYEPDMTQYIQAKARIKKELQTTLSEYKVFQPYTNELLGFLMELWRSYQTALKTDESGQAVGLSDIYKEIKDLNLLLDKEFPFLEVDKIIFYKKGSRNKISISKDYAKGLVLRALKSDKSLRSQSKNYDNYILKGRSKQESVTCLKDASKDLIKFINEGFFLYGPIFRAKELSKHFKSTTEKYVFISDMLSLVTEDINQKSLSFIDIKKYLKT